MPCSPGRTISLCLSPSQVSLHELIHTLPCQLTREQEPETFLKRAINTSGTKNSPLRLVLFDQSVLLYLLCDRSVSGCVVVVEGEWEVGVEKSAYGLWVVGIRLGM